MPELDGVEVIRALAKLNYQPSIVLISGVNKSLLGSVRQLVEQHGIRIIDSLTKPIVLADLMKILGRPQVNRTYGEGANRPGIDTISEEALEAAIRNQQLVLHYQPQIELKTGQLSGAEALVRWQHPQLGLIFPDAFIPLAESSGLIASLTEFVIKQAVQQSSEWRGQGIVVGISVNISSENITSLELPEQLSILVAEEKLDPSCLILEITETAVMHDLAKSMDILARLRMRGFRLSIDDFGTGYSSLAQLHRIPFTELKVDRSFVMNMEKDDMAKAIVESCIMLGHKLGMNIVAEGVETANAMEMLKNMDCDIGQGYHIARPMDATKMLDWIKNRK